ncbi:S8 family serine peptidase [Flavobacteriaceae bacterium]|nr:S8 family serine peptidase [Flavobacteriaceae bacterium]RZP00263.1 MAG: T9SS type A sorting domain-containing protein [Flavobacteriales bacterium]
MKYLLIYVVFLYSNIILCQQEYAWVYFKDKKNVEYLINNPELILTEYSILKKQTKGITIDYDDVPINQDYLEIIKGIDNILILAKSKWLNCIYVVADLDLLYDLNDLSFVDNVLFANKSLNPNKNTNYENIDDYPLFDKTIDYGSTQNQIEMLNLDFLHDNEFTGNGINMAVIDAGFVNVNSMNSFSRLRDSDKILYTYDFVLNTENIYQYQGNSHGTKVLSTIAGFIQDEFVGTAPDASFYLFRTEDVSSETPVEECYWVEAVEVADSLGVDIINTSLGYKGYDNSDYSHTQLDLNGYTTFITRGANIASKKGILLVNSAGNSSTNGIIAPADSQGVLSIGAVDSEGVYASFSSQGSDIQPSIKPDVVAQGYQSKVINIYDQIVSNSGTSFSSPIMAGAIACFMQAYPRLSANEIMNLIRESSSQFNNPDYQLGYGIPNLHNAYELASNLTLDNFIVYPNPVINYLNVISQWNISNYHIDIFDINGKLIYSNYFTNPRPIINTDLFSKGIYLMKISYLIDGQYKSILKKIIKK